MLSLPKTIQDAIKTTRKLQIDFLWVDALCIVQDDESEKQSEIVRMKDFYRSSIVTVSAASAPESEEGFLSDRRAIEQSVHLIFTMPDAALGKIILVRHVPQPHPRMFLCPGIEPINTRAWTAQESLLSNRVLIYGRLQLFWKCRSTYAADGGIMSWHDFKNHSAWPELEVGGRFKPQAESKSCQSSATVHMTESEHSELRRAWLFVVGSYSGRKLSVMADRLPAISAIASLFQEWLEDDYVCGLWRRTILYDLFWEFNDHTPLTLNPEGPYIGPSWSWISYPRGVSYVHWPNQAPIAKVRSYVSKPVYPFAPFGQISEASLTLEAPFHTLNIRERKAGTRTIYNLHRTPGGRSKCTRVATFQPDFPDSLDNCPRTGFPCVLIHSASGGRMVNGLVLRSIGNGQYKRVGTLQQNALRMHRTADSYQCGCLDKTMQEQEAEDEALVEFMASWAWKTIVLA